MIHGHEDGVKDDAYGNEEIDEWIEYKQLQVGSHFAPTRRTLQAQHG